MRPFAAALLVLAMGTSRAPSATAAWPNSAYANLGVCTATNSQCDPQVVSDGAGGAIMVWYDSRGP